MNFGVVDSWIFWFSHLLTLCCFWYFDFTMSLSFVYMISDSMPSCNLQIMDLPCLPSLYGQWTINTLNICLVTNYIISFSPQMSIQTGIPPPDETPVVTVSQSKLIPVVTSIQVEAIQSLSKIWCHLKMSANENNGRGWWAILSLSQIGC